MEEYNVSLSLANLAEGRLDQEFQTLYKKTLAAIKPGEKGSVTVTVTLARVKDTETMVEVGYSIKATTPARKRSSMAIIKGEKDGQLSLLTNEARKRPEVANMFDAKAKAKV